MADRTVHMIEPLVDLEKVSEWASYISALMFAFAAVAASSVPARRATRVDPLVALRCE